MASTKRKATSERQLEIVQAAREILVSEGFHKLTLRSVANKVGIKLASLQYHFSNRAALIQALIGQLLTPEQIKRGGTGSATNKAFERYFQPRRAESVKVTSAIKKLQRKNKGEIVEFVKKK